MAEFKTIMSGWNALCERQKGCSDCPVIKNGLKDACGTPNVMDGDKIQAIEAIVLHEMPIWERDRTPLGVFYHCSKCGCKSERPSRYCPDCGKMMGSGRE